MHWFVWLVVLGGHLQTVSEYWIYWKFTSSALWTGFLCWDEEEAWFLPSHAGTGHELRQRCSRYLLRFACFLTKGGAQKWIVALSLFEEQEYLLLTGLWGCKALLEMDVAVPTFGLRYVHGLLRLGSPPEAEGSVSNMPWRSTQHTRPSRPSVLGDGCST